MRRRRTWRLVITVLTVLFPTDSFAAAAPSEALPAIMVFNVRHEEQAGPGIAAMLTELVLQDLHDLKQFRVVGEKDVGQMVSQERLKLVTGCKDTSCMIEIADAIGTRYSVSATVGVLGSSNLLSLALIDVRAAVVISRKTAVLKGERDKLLDAVHRLIKELMEPVLTPGAPVSGARPPGVIQDNDQGKPPDRAQEERGKATIGEGPNAGETVIPPTSPYKLWGHALFWPGMALVVFGGASQGMAYATAQDARKGAASAVDANSTWSSLAVSGYAIGGAVALTGVILLFLSPGDETRARGHQVSIAPSTRGDGLTVGFAGRW